MKLTKLIRETSCVFTSPIHFFERKFSFDSVEEIKRKSKLLARGLPKQKPIPGVRKVILVASGKGGVGKSTVAVNLATALKICYPDKNIGLLDTDIFGPTIPLMMNLYDTPALNKDNKMIPLINYGVKCMSLGFLVSRDSPVIWRGLMVMQALEKLLWQVFWDSLDYLIIDTPPGTGDTHLSLIQNIFISGTILVTTPQLASTQVSKKGGIMFRNLNIPILGIVENMSYVRCTACSENIKLFGSGTSKLAEELNTTVLESFPIEKDINYSVDHGTPVVLIRENSEVARLFINLAKNVAGICKNIQDADLYI